MKPLSRANANRPQALTQFLRDIGPRWQQDIRAAGDLTKQTYLPYLANQPKSGVDIQRAIAYGAHPRQQLDVYRPVGAIKAPVVVFVHGGAFIRGQKDINAEMYANVLIWFARRGYLGVNVEYRLAPEAPYPAGAMDVAQACRWVRQNISALNGDPERICLIGHSAGGTHAATYLFDPAVQRHGCDVGCAVLISARLRADVKPENPNAAGVSAYFGDNPHDHAQHSPIAHAANSALPVFLVNAEFENPLLDLYSLEMALEIARARGVAPRHMTMVDHNHVSIMAHFNSGEETLGVAILDFFENACPL